MQNKLHTVTVDSAQTVALIHQFICSIESCNHLHACVHAAAAYILHASHAEHAAAAHACVPRSSFIDASGTATQLPLLRTTVPVASQFAIGDPARLQLLQSGTGDLAR